MNLNQKYIPSKLFNLPYHDEDRYESYQEFEKDGKKGFKLQDGTTIYFEPNGGWVDENGCRYDQNGNCDGWFVADSQGKEHYYDQNGQYIPSDEEYVQDLPEHLNHGWVIKKNYAVYEDQKYIIDNFEGWEDREGCYYELDDGVPCGWIPFGWMIKKADGKLYLFDLNGQYVEREDTNNDLLQYDISVAKKEQKNRMKHPTQSQTFSSLPLSSQPLRSQPLRSLPLSSQPLRSLPLSSQPLRSQQIYSAPNIIHQKCSVGFKLLDSQDNPTNMELLKEFLRQKGGQDTLEFLVNFKKSEVTVKMAREIQSITSLQSFQYSEGKKAEMLDIKKNK